MEGNELLCEFHLKTNGWLIEQRVDIIHSLYTSCLLEDDLWHFFHEEEQGDIIRCKPENADKIKERIGYHEGIEYDFKETWVETIPEVVKYPEYFARIFHANSLLVLETLGDGMEINERNFMSIIDRIIHSIYINSIMFGNDIRNPEETLVGSVANGRAFYSGRRYQYLLEHRKDGD